MKRTTLIFLTILTLSVLLTACGRDNGAVSTDPNSIIGNNQTSPSSPDTPRDNSIGEEFNPATDPFEDGLDQFPFGTEDEAGSQTEQPNSDAENAVEEQNQTVDPQVRKRSSGTGMTGGQ